MGIVRLYTPLGTPSLKDPIIYLQRLQGSTSGLSPGRAPVGGEFHLRHFGTTSKGLLARQGRRCLDVHGALGILFVPSPPFRKPLCFCWLSFLLTISWYVLQLPCGSTSCAQALLQHPLHKSPIQRWLPISMHVCIYIYIHMYVYT